MIASQAGPDVGSAISSAADNKIPPPVVLGDFESCLMSATGSQPRTSSPPGRPGPFPAPQSSHAVRFRCRPSRSAAGGGRFAGTPVYLTADTSVAPSRAAVPASAGLGVLDGPTRTGSTATWAAATKA